MLKNSRAQFELSKTFKHQSTFNIVSPFNVLRFFFFVVAELFTSQLFQCFTQFVIEVRKKRTANKEKKERDLHTSTMGSLSNTNERERINPKS